MYLSPLLPFLLHSMMDTIGDPHCSHSIFRGPFVISSEHFEHTTQCSQGQARMAVTNFLQT